MTDNRIDWDNVSLVVFDVDGTLYSQSRMRLRMLRSIVSNAARERSLRVARVIGCYRRLREIAGEEELDDFESILMDRTARQVGVDEAAVRAIVSEWIERRPLEYIGACRYSGVSELFQTLRLRSKLIGIYSDYPATQKLAALGLTADYVITAEDADVRRLKPNPRGLRVLMDRAKISPSRTLVIGDRVERDGYAARRAGANALIRSTRVIEGWTCFSDYSDPVFAPVR
jgi:HAD superfamily hydrolase (TIGR01549 family)